MNKTFLTTVKKKCKKSVKRSKSYVYNIVFYPLWFYIYLLHTILAFIVFIPNTMIMEMLHDQIKKNIIDKTVSKTAKLHIGECYYLPWFITELLLELV